MQCVLFLGGSLSNSMKVVILRDDLAELKMKLKCSQEQFVDLQKHYTQQLIQPDLRLMSASLLTTEEPP